MRPPQPRWAYSFDRAARQIIPTRDVEAVTALLHPPRLRRIVALAQTVEA